MRREFKRSASLLLVLSLFIGLFPQLIFADNLSSEKEFLSFSLEGNEGIIDNNNHTITVNVPFRSYVTNMFEIFTVSSGASVLGHTSYASRNDYTDPVPLTVVAEDGSMQDYSVTVIIGKSNLKSMTSFSLSNPISNGFIDDEAYAIFLTVPEGTDVTKLKPSFYTNGDEVRVNGVKQVSGVTPQDFTNPLNYTAVATDGSTRDYLVTVQIQKQLSTAKEMTSFSFASLTAFGTIDETNHMISITVPNGTNLSTLVPVFTTTGNIVRVNGLQQVSGEVSYNYINFNSLVTYNVYDEAGGVQSYTVIVNVAPSDAGSTNAFQTFSIDGIDGIVDEENHTITVIFPNGKNRNNQKATFTTNGEFVRVGNAIQSSGQTINDFTQPLTYTVFADNGLTQNYVVTVVLANEITSYDLTYPIHAPGLIDTVNHTISIQVPDGTDLTVTKATYVTTGDHLSINGVVQNSGVTETDLSSTRTIDTVDSENAVIPYTLILNVVLSSSKELTSFRITSPASIGAVNQSNHTVTMTVPYGTKLTELTPHFTNTGAMVKVGPVEQISGVTKQDFTNPVTYTIYAADGTSQDYVVTVEVAKKTSSGGSHSNSNSSDNNEITPPTQLPDTVFTSAVNPSKVEEFLKARVEQEKANPVGHQFSDVGNHWSKANIDLFDKLGVISGYEDDTFRPDASITRAEFAVIIAKIFNVETKANSLVLSDLQDHWASSAVTALASNGIITGYEDGMFKPDKTISRAEIIAIIGRLVDLDATDKRQSASFKDIDGSWNAKDIIAAASAGLVEGRNSSTFAPNESSTRAEALTIILRVLNLDPNYKSILDQLLLK